jgi:hypothetical protein
LVRAELLTEEVVDLLKKTACKRIFMCVEAGNNNIKKNLLNRKIPKKRC